MFGRQPFCSLHTEPLGQLATWLNQFLQPSGWERHLDALTTEVYRTRREHRGHHGREATGRRTPTTKEDTA